MAVGIVHAYSSEEGSKYGAVGDQLQTSSSNDTKGEIRIGNWYKRDGGWGVYLECTDAALAKEAAAWAVKIANNKNFGYSQSGDSKIGRWSGYKVIKSKGIEGGQGNFDCSSLVIACYILAGCQNLKATGYTGSMEKLLLATGKFKKYTDSAHVDSSKLATLGGVYIKSGAHTVIVTDAVAPSTQTASSERHILLSGNVWVRQKPNPSGKKLFIARKGEKLPYMNIQEADNRGCYWYKVDTDKGIGWISAFTGKSQKYTTLI